MLTVEYMLLSTALRLTYGLITRPAVRCESTWSGPFCASSSMMKMANALQTLLFVIASTILPTATSFDATCAFGV